ncbi:hypothetical protein PQX77_000839 [Marasmius sp. AFHP31]|nr:hypothetical protein PQX77_000839 [Marasmius sp. AFHP31]
MFSNARNPDGHDGYLDFCIGAFGSGFTLKRAALMREREKETDSVVSHVKTGTSVQIRKILGTLRPTRRSTSQEHGCKSRVFRRIRQHLNCCNDTLAPPTRRKPRS